MDSNFRVSREYAKERLDQAVTLRWDEYLDLLWTDLTNLLGASSNYAKRRA